MIKEAIGFGNTVDEAKEDAISRLGADIDDDIQIDIISMPKKRQNPCSPRLNWSTGRKYLQTAKRAKQLHILTQYLKTLSVRMCR